MSSPGPDRGSRECGTDDQHAVCYLNTQGQGGNGSPLASPGPVRKVQSVPEKRPPSAPDGYERRVQVPRETKGRAAYLQQTVRTHTRTGRGGPRGRPAAFRYPQMTAGWTRGDNSRRRSRTELLPLANEPRNRLSPPTRVISSVGRALRLHRRCREFESLITHHDFVVLGPYQCRFGAICGRSRVNMAIEAQFPVARDTIFERTLRNCLSRAVTCGHCYVASGPYLWNVWPQ